MAIITQKQGNLEYLTAEGIGAKHCFTTRFGGVSTGYLGSMNIGANRGDRFENVAENYRILGESLDFDPLNTVLTRQTHSDIVRLVTKHHHMGFDHRHYPECDGLITNDPGTALVIFSADCTPILLWDPVTGAVGAAHAGWRGTAQNIAGKTVAAMCREFGCDPQNIHAAIGPNIGPCCFQTDEEVPQALMETYGPTVRPYIQKKSGKYYPDLKKINHLALQNAGLTHIDISKDCTMCQPGRFWSHRFHGATRGSQGAIIVR
ncbi:MAG: peptidoglycan editing factor PgeF [Oscillospiraceae bacterium]|nr:peptidoglycan editing factor PgeF [Oscillospiraceae bacterium]